MKVFFSGSIYHCAIFITHKWDIWEYGEEIFAVNAGRDTILLRKVNIKKMLGNIIEKIKEIDIDKLEKEVEDEGNRIARKKYPKVFS